MLTVYPIRLRSSYVQKPPLQELFFLYSLLFMADCCILIIIYSFRNVFSTATDGGGSIQKHVLLFAKRAIKPVQGRTGLILPLFPLVSFCRYCFVPAVFFLSTDTDVGGSKQKRVLLSKTCYQTCTRMYRFDNRFPKPHNFTIVHGWTWFHAGTSLTFRQTRLQALYTDVQRLKVDFRFNRCPGGENNYAVNKNKILYS